VGSMKQLDDPESMSVAMREPVGVFRYMTGESENGVVEQRKTSWRFCSGKSGTLGVRRRTGMPAVSSTCLKPWSAQQGRHSFRCWLSGLCLGVTGIGSPCGPYPHSRGKDLGRGGTGVPAPREVRGWFWAQTLCQLSPYPGSGQQSSRMEPQRQHGTLVGVE